LTAAVSGTLRWEAAVGALQHAPASFGGLALESLLAADHQHITLHLHVEIRLLHSRRLDAHDQPLLVLEHVAAEHGPALAGQVQRIVDLVARREACVVVRLEAGERPAAERRRRSQPSPIDSFRASRLWRMSSRFMTHAPSPVGRGWGGLMRDSQPRTKPLTSPER
jgi:hypothetical protein